MVKMKNSETREVDKGTLREGRDLAQVRKNTHAREPRAALLGQSRAGVM